MSTQERLGEQLSIVAVNRSRCSRSSSEHAFSRLQRCVGKFSRGEYKHGCKNTSKLECGPVPNVMAALPNIGGAFWSTLQSLADAHYWSAVQ